MTTLHTNTHKLPVLIVGAGMAGLSCALHLHQAGMPVCILEADKCVGGRVQTDEMDGFLLDRGFQVYLDAYPETGALLDMNALDLRPFKSGALVFRNGSLHRLMDVFRHPLSIWSSITAPVGGLLDKLRVGLLRTKLQMSSLSAIATREDQSTEAYLYECGFSKDMIDAFFRTSMEVSSLNGNYARPVECLNLPLRCLAEAGQLYPRRAWVRLPCNWQLVCRQKLSD